MNILTVVDKKGSAIDLLAEMTKKYSNENIEIVSVHPKRESPDGLERFRILAEKADVIDFQYWKTAVMLLDKYPEFKDKPSILTHHNPYDVIREDYDWRDYKFNLIVAKNQSQYKELEKAGYHNIKYIKHAVDFDKFDFDLNYDRTSKKVLMVAARIEGKKGVKEVAEVCKELGYDFHLVGSISKMGYFDEVIAVGGVSYHQQIPDEDLYELYKKSAIHVCNSKDNFESGTMPILESMACGLPVLTRNVGLVPDIDNGKNMVVRYGEQGDKEELKKEMKALMDNPKKREDMRIEAYRSVLYYNAELMAREYTKSFREVLYPHHKIVSVIVPTIPENGNTTVPKIIQAYKNQTYPNIELIVVTDNLDGYNLARSRNEGVINAMGDILIFNDDRMCPDKDTVANFVTKIRPNVWLFGNKDNAKKKSFVENFSCIFRKEFIGAGMFNERMDEYGGMSQELRERFGRQGFELEYVDNCRAKTLKKSSRTKRLKNIRRMKTKLYKMGLYE